VEPAVVVVFITAAVLCLKLNYSPPAQFDSTSSETDASSGAFSGHGS
jgi:hypothetical protein